MMFFNQKLKKINREKCENRLLFSNFGGEIR